MRGRADMHARGPIGAKSSVLVLALTGLAEARTVSLMAHLTYRRVLQPVTLPVAYLTQVGDHPSLAARRSGAPRHRGSIGRVRATLLQQPLQEPPRPRALRRAALHRSLAHAQACRGARRRRYSICRPDGRGLARESGVEPTPNVWVLNRIKAVKTRR